MTTTYEPSFAFVSPGTLPGEVPENAVSVLDFDAFDRETLLGWIHDRRALFAGSFVVIVVSSGQRLDHETRGKIFVGGGLIFTIPGYAATPAHERPKAFRTHYEALNTHLKANRLPIPEPDLAEELPEETPQDRERALLERMNAGDENSDVE